jgi:hypothetical protein
MQSGDPLALEQGQVWERLVAGTFTAVKGSRTH